nr:hypothetical protein [Tanacetum cinerariifolium]
MDAGCVDPKLVKGMNEPVSTIPKCFASLVTNEVVMCKGISESVPIWVKFYYIPIMAFTIDVLSVMATKLGNPVMLDSYMISMWLQSWGRMDYARALIDIKVDDLVNEYNDSKVEEAKILCLQELRGSYPEYFSATMLHVGYFIFKPIQRLQDDEMTHLSLGKGFPCCNRAWGSEFELERSKTKEGANTAVVDANKKNEHVHSVEGASETQSDGNIRQGVTPTPIGTTALSIESVLINVTDSPSIDLNNTGSIISRLALYAKLVTSELSRKSLNFCTLITPAGNEGDEVVPLECIRAVSERTNVEISKSAGKGSLNVAHGSYSNTPIIDKIDKLECQMLDGKRIVDNDGKPLVPTSNVDSESEMKVVFDETANLRALTSFKGESDRGYGTNSLWEQWIETKQDDDYDPYDDDLYERSVGLLVEVERSDGVTPSVVDMMVEIGKHKSLDDTIFLEYFPPLFMHVNTAGNTPGKSSYANITSKPSMKKVNVHTLFTPGEGAYPVVANYNTSLILKKWHPDENLLKEDVSTVLVWVKLYGVPVMAFNEDGLSAIATKLGTLLMFDSYTSDMCMQSWGRSSYARVMIELRAELRANVELKDNIVVSMPKINREGHYTCAGERKTVKKPSQSSRGVEPTIEVSNSNPFDVLNSIDNDVEFGTNGRLLIWLLDNDGNQLVSSGIIESDSEVEVVFDETVNLSISTSGKDKSDKGYGTNSLLEQWRDSYPDNDVYDPYDDDMYENHDLSEHLQSICDDLDTTVHDRKKK